MNRPDASIGSGEDWGRPSAIKAPPAVPVLLALVAGIVDSTTFMALFGLFVAQVTGSFVTLGVHIVIQDKASMVSLAAIPFFFLGCVAAVTVAAAVALAPYALATALAIEAALLGAFTAVGLVAAPFADPNAPSAVLMGILGLAAMGVQSATVRVMLRSASTNVMTTNLTHLAIDATQWLIAGWRARSPHDAAARATRAAAGARLAQLAPTMAGFFAGTLAGAAGFAYLGFCFLPVAVAILIGLTGWALRAAGGHGSASAARSPNA